MKSFFGTLIAGVVLLMLGSVNASANADKAKTAYNKCLSEL